MHAAAALGAHFARIAGIVAGAAILWIPIEVDATVAALGGAAKTAEAAGPLHTDLLVEVALVAAAAAVLRIRGEVDAARTAL